ncbi:MAG: hypothetical protein A2X48_16160 [Lentisphaerae bacterium GWF2_49_21]|nr:MAG: hypothetical protein A2X48_16160 [Lentisphaerae bacterium GWF2_49_21]
MGGMAFLSSETVLPSIIKDLGGSAWLISFMPVMMTLGWVLPPIFTAHFVERLHKVKRFTLTLGIFQRIPYIFAALMLMFYKDAPPFLLLCIVASAPFISGFLGGIGAGAFGELTARLIPSNRLASVYSLRFIITVLIGLAAGFAVKDILTIFPGVFGYGILHLIAFGFLCLAWFALAMTEDEHVPEKKQAAKHVDMMDNLSNVPVIIRNDPRLRNYLLMAFFGTGNFIFIPFLAIYALETLGRDLSFTGVLLIAQMLGGITGNLAAGLIGDYISTKRVIIISRICMMAVCMAIPFSGSEMMFLGVFFLYGAAFFMDRVGVMTMANQISPVEKRPTYLSIITFNGFPAMVSAALLSTLLQVMFNSIIPAAMIAISAMMVSLFFVLKIKEEKNA